MTQWCIEHDCSADGSSNGCFIADLGVWQECRISEALVIVKDADGEWPEWALRAMGTGFSADILEALYVASNSLTLARAWRLPRTGVPGSKNQVNPNQVGEPG